MITKEELETTNNFVKKFFSEGYPLDVAAGLASQETGILIHCADGARLVGIDPEPYTNVFEKLNKGLANQR